MTKSESNQVNSRTRGDSPTPRRAKLFWNGSSQAVRLPQEFRLPGNEVAVWRDGDRVILEPLPTGLGWPAGYWDQLDAMKRYFENLSVRSPELDRTGPPSVT